MNLIFPDYLAQNFCDLLYSFLRMSTIEKRKQERAMIILKANQFKDFNILAQECNCSPKTIKKWINRFLVFLDEWESKKQKKTCLMSY
jgi:uncharacterized protein YjcR